ncbi:MAG: hypothetical protein R3F59_20210 [Myxococcota bacterium]
MGPLLVATGWLAMPAEARPNKACWMPSRLLYVGRSTLQYTGPAEAQRREADAAALERRPARRIGAGWLAVDIDRLTLEAADPAHQLVVVERGSEVVLRYEPPQAIPEADPEIPGFWYAYAVVPLPDGLAPPFRVEVVDRLQQIACAWTVDAHGEVALEGKRKAGE